MGIKIRFFDQTTKKLIRSQNRCCNKRSKDEKKIENYENNFLLNIDSSSIEKELD
jgi:hypothetical protein